MKKSMRSVGAGMNKEVQKFNFVYDRSEASKCLICHDPKCTKVCPQAATCAGWFVPKERLVRQAGRFGNDNRKQGVYQRSMRIDSCDTLPAFFIGNMILSND